MKLNILVLSALLTCITFAVELNHDILDITAAVNQIGFNSLNNVIPRVVVIGDQSSAKSSFVEALTGFQMPKQDAVKTTVAPIQIVTKNDPRFDFKANVSSGYQFEEVHSAKDLSGKIHEFQLESLRKWQKSSEERGKDDFSEISVSVVIQGKTVKDMVITDMPGFVWTDGSTDQIMAMIEKQLGNSASVLVATRECRNKIVNFNQALPSRLEPELIEKKKRTLHIITKPDNCDGVELESFLGNKLGGKDSEYFVVYTHPAVLNKKTTEEAFFQKKAPSIVQKLYKKYPERFGIKNVAKALSAALNEQFGRHAFEIKSELLTKLDELKSEKQSIIDDIEKTGPISSIGTNIASIISYIVGFNDVSISTIAKTMNLNNSYIDDLTNSIKNESDKLEANLRDKTRNSILFYSITRPKMNGEIERVPEQHTKNMLYKEFGQIGESYALTEKNQRFCAGVYQHVQPAIMNSVALRRAQEAMKDWEDEAVETVKNVAKKYKEKIRDFIDAALQTFKKNVSEQEKAYYMKSIQNLLRRVELKVDKAATSAATHTRQVVLGEQVRRLNSNTQKLEALLHHYSKTIQECIDESDSEAVKNAVKEVAMVGTVSAGAFSVAVTGAEAAGAVAATAANAAMAAVFPVVPKMFGQAIGSAVTASITGMAVPVIGAGSLAYLGLRIAHEAGIKLHEGIEEWNRRRVDVEYNNKQNLKKALAYMFKKELEESKTQTDQNSLSSEKPKAIGLPLKIAIFAQETAFLHYSHSRVNDEVQLAINFYLKKDLLRDLTEDIMGELSKWGNIKGSKERSCENKKVCEHQINNVEEALAKLNAFINQNEISTFY
ncbi:hypothetical protein MP638_002104 [Amoeboaphelidium occidentale]|nr:hypothetical protein MP638_002104 [Amoeboaphelidium occidentale]